MNTFYIMKNVLIGYQLKEIGELLTHQKRWDDIDTPEKIFFMLVVLMIVFSFSATVVFTVWAQKRIKGKQIAWIKKRNRKTKISEKRKRNRNHNEIWIRTDFSRK